MEKKLTWPVFVLALFCLSGFAQQDPQFTQFMRSKLMYNPAYAGTNHAVCVNTVYRQQWVSFPGAPKTGLVNVDMYNSALGGIGVGLSLMNDQLGADKTWSARGSFAKHFSFASNGILSVAIDAGILQKQINGTWIAPQTLNDPQIPSNGFSPAFNKLVPDLGAGVYCTVPGRFYAGLSVSHIPASDMKGASGSQGGNSYNLSFKMARHYYLIAGYTFFAGSPDHALTPNVKIKSDGSSTQLDVNLTYEFRNLVWLGASWRMQDAIAPMIGIKQGSFKIGYSYDATTSKIRSFSSGSHEIFMSYCFAPAKPIKLGSHQVDRYFD